MSRAADATCGTAFGASDRVLPSRESGSRPEAVNLRFAIPFLAKPYRITVLAEPLRLSSEPPCRDGDRHPLAARFHRGTQFVAAFVVGGYCWFGVESLAVKVLHLIGL